MLSAEAPWERKVPWALGHRPAGQSRNASYSTLCNAHWNAQCTVEYSAQCNAQCTVQGTVKCPVCFPRSAGLTLTPTIRLQWLLGQKGNAKFAGKSGIIETVRSNFASNLVYPAAKLPPENWTCRAGADSALLLFTWNESGGSPARLNQSRDLWYCQPMQRADRLTGAKLLKSPKSFLWELGIKARCCNVMALVSRPREP